MPSQDAAVEDREGRVILKGPRGKWTGCAFQKAEPTSVEDFTVGKAHNPFPMDPGVDCSLPFLRLLTGGFWRSCPCSISAHDAELLFRAMASPNPPPPSCPCDEEQRRWTLTPSLICSWMTTHATWPRAMS